MVVQAKRFAELVDSLIQQIAIKKGGRQKYRTAELEVAWLLNVSQSTVQTWRRGKHMPSNPAEVAEQLVELGVKKWDMDITWADSLLLQTWHPMRSEVLQRLFTVPQASAGGQESPEDPVPLNSLFYVERATDVQALEAIRRPGVTMTIKGPAKMGKTSLLYRIRAAAQEIGKRTIVLNFREFDHETFADAATFFRQFCSRIGEELGIEDQVSQAWNLDSTNPANCRRYILRHILTQIADPLVLSLENVDTIFTAPFRSDFFGMLRSWHDDGQFRPIWQRLDRVLVTSTEPYQFVDDLHKSPFNVGEVITLDDFTVEQIADLNRRYDYPLQRGEVTQLAELVHGHPYLARRALYQVAREYISAEALLAHAADDDGPFRDHLAALLADLMNGETAVRRALRQVVTQGTPPDYDIFFRLHGAGLVRRDGSHVLPRCRLYADYFRERLHE